MSQLKTNIFDIKIVAKNLAKELKAMKFNITHSAALNLAARSLGFTNYNTYKAIPKLTNLDMASNMKVEIGSKTFSEMEKELTIKRLEQYPSIDNNFIKFGKSNEYDIFIHEEDNVYFLLFRLKNNSTGRVFFNPRYESFSLFVYPNVKTAFNSYDISIQDISTKHLNLEYFNVTKHLLQSKKWIGENLAIMDDLFALMDIVSDNRAWFQEIIKEHSEEKLSNIWNRKNT